MIVNLYAHFVNGLRSVESKRGKDQKPYCRSELQRACYVELDIYFIGSEYDDGSEGVSFTPAHPQEVPASFPNMSFLDLISWAVFVKRWLYIR